MKKFAYALATIALFAEPAIALPIDRMPAPTVVSESQVVPVALGHQRRVPAEACAARSGLSDAPISGAITKRSRR